MELFKVIFYCFCLVSLSVNAEVAVKKANAKVVVKKANAEVVVKKANAEVVVKKANAEVVVKKANAEVVVKKANAEVVVKKANAEVVVKKASAEIAVQKASAKVVVKKANATEPAATYSVTSSESVLTTANSSQSNSLFDYSTVEVGFEYPLNFGTHIKYYLSKNFYSRLGVGFMAEFFLGSFAKLAPYLGYLNNHEATVISHIFESSFYTDLRFGWFPYAQSSDGGPYLELGVSGMFFGRGQVSGFTLSKALNLELDSVGHYSIKTNAYNGTLHIGYQIPFERLKLNIEAGFIKIFHTQLRSASVIGAPNQLNAEQKKVLQRFLHKKGWIFPTASGWIGFSF